INIGDLPYVRNHLSAIQSEFADHPSELLGPNKVTRILRNVKEMTIQVDPSDTTPLLRAKTSWWTAVEEKVLNKYDDKMCRAGRLELSTSTMCVQPILVVKKDSSWRIVFNFAPINWRIIGMVWPLEPVDKVVQMIAQWKLLSCFDFSLGYHQLSIKPVSQ
ncbi:hypothetical protein HDU87_005863, partial [Geranomyces variabilis]